MLRFLLGLGGPLIKMLGVTALQEAMDALQKQFDRIEAQNKEILDRLAAVEKRNNAVFHGWELMEKARKVGRHADAAEPPLPDETLQERTRRFARHVTPDPDPTPDESRGAVVNVESEDPDEERPEDVV